MRRVTLVLFALAGLLAASSTQFTAKAIDGENKAKLSKMLAFTPQQPAGNDSELQKLLKQRYEVAWNEMSEAFKRAQANGNLDALGSYESVNQLVASFMALDPKPADRLEMLNGLVEYAREREAILNKLVSSGAVEKRELHHAIYFRLDAEIMLAKEKEGKK